MKSKFLIILTLSLASAAAQASDVCPSKITLGKAQFFTEEFPSDAQIKTGFDQTYTLPKYEKNDLTVAQAWVKKIAGVYSDGALTLTPALVGDDCQGTVAGMAYNYDPVYGITFLLDEFGRDDVTIVPTSLVAKVTFNINWPTGACSSGCFSEQELFQFGSVTVTP